MFFCQIEEKEAIKKPLFYVYCTYVLLFLMY